VADTTDSGQSRWRPVFVVQGRPVRVATIREGRWRTARIRGPGYEIVHTGPATGGERQLTRTAGRTEREMQEIALADGRHLRVNGTCNLRDVGGYPVHAGGSVACRTLFRSDSLHRLDNHGVGQLAELDLHTIVDLRADIEVQRAPTTGMGLPARIVRAPVVRDPTTLPPLSDLGAEYRYTIDECGDSIGAAVGELCARGALPALVHCAAGKDRTGIVIALVLAVLGVPDELIGADYALSSIYLDADSTAGIDKPEVIGAGDNVTAELLSRPAGPILDVLGRARAAGGGSVCGYLTAHGVRASDLAALRSALLR
jgi:protein-tyrosine phosphatase